MTILTVKEFTIGRMARATMAFGKTISSKVMEGIHSRRQRPLKSFTKATFQTTKGMDTVN